MNAINSIPLFFASTGRFPNLGDDLSPYIVSKLTGRTVEVFKEDRPIVLYGIGSILDRVKFPGQVIWGSGFISYDSKIISPNVFAVRGPLSLNKLNLVKSVPVGDPALLMPKIYSSTRVKEYKIGIIPHYIDQKTFVQRFRCDDPCRFLVINIKTNKFEAFIAQLCCCEFIVSSSLHGLILAHAYGIPAVWIELSEQVVGRGFKFFDYFLSVSIPPYRAVNFKSGEIRLSNLIALRHKKGVSFEIVNFDTNGLVESLGHAIDYLDRTMADASNPEAL